MAKKSKKDSYDDSWMYILLLTTITILAYSLSTYTFKIAGVSLTYSIFLLPVLYLIANYITKKYCCEKAVLAIVISSISIVIFTLIMNFAMGKSTSISVFTGSFCALVVSHLVNLLIYRFLNSNTEAPFLLVLLNYLFALVTFYAFYTLIYLNMIILDDYWLGYFITLVIQTIMCIGLAYLDKKIKLGRE